MLISRPTSVTCASKINSIRTITLSARHLKKVGPEALKSNTNKASSQQWLSRHLSDPYVEKAKRLNYRCRSAFKLIEINDRFNILKPGDTVLDVGASPGSWTQVMVGCVNSNGSKDSLPKGTVIAIDKQQMYPIKGASILGNMDFTETKTQKEILDLLGGRKVDGVLSDMAPSATGVRELDNENMIGLCYSVLRFALQISKIDATVLVKLWQCGELEKFEQNMAKFYRNVKVVKPNASRSDSAEIYLLGRNFTGLNHLNT